MTSRKNQQRQNPVILVHGLWNTSGIFDKLKPYLEAQGRKVHAFTLKPNNGDAGIDQLAKQLQTLINNTLDKHPSFDLVGFSMGGLISRYYLQNLGGISRVQHFVTVATPHHGSAMAFFRWNPGGIQMRPGSHFLRELNHNMHVLQQITLTSLWTPFDLLVIPGSSGCLPIGYSQRLWVASHNNMIRHETGLRAIEAALTRPG